MSRIANSPVTLPSGVELSQTGSRLSVKGSKGELSIDLHELVEVTRDGDVVNVAARRNSRKAVALAGTTRSLINNMVTGVSQGFERRLQLQGVGYRAKAQGQNLTLTVGYSQPVDYPIPEGVTADTPSNTEIVLTSANKELVGEVASRVRKVRPPEPYKGKGIRYADELIYRKEAKKK